MAIDKSRTSPFVKGVIIFIAITFVLGIGGASLVPLLQSITSPGAAATTAGSTAATDTIAAISAKYSPRTVTNDESLKADPKNYELLLAQARAYHDWAGEILQAEKTQTGADRPLWLLAVEYYKRAVAVKSGDSGVMTDMAISQFYSGDVPTAMATADAVVKADPKFAPVHFNLGVFFGATGDNARAISEYQAYIKLEPTGQLVTEANSRIASLKTASTPATTTP